MAWNNKSIVRGDTEQEPITQLAKHIAEQVLISTNHMSSALKYVLKAHCKEGEPPFNWCTSGNTGGKAIKKDSGANLSILKGSDMLPTQNMFQSKVSRSSLPGFVSCSRTLLDEEENLLNAQTKEGFNSNAYKLMEKAGYNFNNPVVLGKVVKVQTYGLNKMQKKIQEQEDLIEVQKVGLSYTPVQPIKISGRRKAEQNVIQHISAEEIDESG